MYILTQEEFDALQEKNVKLQKMLEMFFKTSVLVQQIANQSKKVGMQESLGVVFSPKKVNGIVTIALFKTFVQKTLKNGANDEIS